MKSYRLDSRIRNNCLLSAMHANGISHAADLSRRSGVSQTVIGQLMNLKITGFIKQSSTWRPSLVRLADFLRVTPDLLIPPEYAQTPMEKNRGEFEMSMEELPSIADQAVPQNSETPFNVIAQREQSKCLTRMLDRLTHREALVIGHRYGLSGEILTYSKVGKALGVSGNRAQCIEKKALRKLKIMSRQGLEGDRIRSTLDIRMAAISPQKEE